MMKTYCLKEKKKEGASILMKSPDEQEPVIYFQPKKQKESIGRDLVLPDDYLALVNPAYLTHTMHF